MTAITALLLFAVWTLVLMFIYVGYRVALVLAMKKKANSWTRGQPTEDPPFVQRAHNAHLNAVENLPIFAAIVLAAHAIGKVPVVDAVAAWVLYLRLAQSVTHLIGTTHALVFVRANFFTLQALLYFYMVWGLLN